MRRAALGLSALLTLLLVFAPPSQAQEEYPPTSDTLPPPEVEDRTFGTVAPGQSFTKRDCGFEPGSTVTIAVGGVAAGTETVAADGCVELVVQAVDADTIAIDGRQYTVACGDLVITVTGVSATGATRTVNNSFTMSCAAGGELSRTGASIARWSAIAVGLIAIGALMVLADRRRSRSGALAG